MNRARNASLGLLLVLSLGGVAYGQMAVLPPARQQVAQPQAGQPGAQAQVAVNWLARIAQHPVARAAYEWRAPLTGATATGLTLAYEYLKSAYPESTLVPSMASLAVGGLASGLVKIYSKKMWPESLSEFFPAGPARDAAIRVGTDWVNAVNVPGPQGGIRGGVKVTVKPVLDTVGEVIDEKVTGGLLGKIFSLKGAVAVTGLVGLVFAARYASSRVEAYLNKPQLSYSLKNAPLGGKGGTLGKHMIFDPEVRGRLNTILFATSAIKASVKSGSETSVYKNLLLYGPTGSGKRMFAEQIAHFAAMDFYEIPWSSFSAFKPGEARKAIENFFESEIQSSPNGSIIFIDNADLFFGDRRTHEISSSPLGQGITAFTEYAQKKSKNYMFVFGVSAKPSIIDDTIAEDKVEITLPKLPERKKLLSHYRDEYFRPDLIKEETAAALGSVLNDTAIELIAQRLNKASASELAGFMKTIKIESELPTSEGLTSQLVDTVLQRSEKQYTDLIV